MKRQNTFFQSNRQAQVYNKDDLNAYLMSLGVTEQQFNRHTFLSKCGTWIYHVSIIDYL